MGPSIGLSAQVDPDCSSVPRLTEGACRRFCNSRGQRARMGTEQSHNSAGPGGSSAVGTNAVYTEGTCIAAHAAP